MLRYRSSTCSQRPSYLVHAEHLAVGAANNDAASDGMEVAFWRMKFPMPLVGRCRLTPG